MSVPVSISFANVPAAAEVTYKFHGRDDYSLDNTQFTRELRAFELLGNDASNAILAHDFYYGKKGTVYIHNDVFTGLEQTFKNYNNKRVADLEKQIAGYDVKIEGHEKWIKENPEEYKKMVEAALDKRESKVKPAPMTAEERIESLKRSRELKALDKDRPTLTVVGSKPKPTKDEDGNVVQPTPEQVRAAYRVITNSENSRNKLRNHLKQLQDQIKAYSAFKVSLNSEDRTLDINFGKNVHICFVGQNSAELKRHKTTDSTLGMKFVDPYSYVCYISSHTVQRTGNSPAVVQNDDGSVTKTPGDTSAAVKALTDVILTPQFINATPVFKSRDMRDKIVDICKRIMDNGNMVMDKAKANNDVARYRVLTVVGDAAESAWNLLVAKSNLYSTHLRELRAAGLVEPKPKPVKKTSEGEEKEKPKSKAKAKPKVAKKATVTEA